MEGVRAGLRDDVDLRAGVAAKLDAVGVRLHLELRHRLGHDLGRRDRDADVVVVRAVDHVVVVARALPVGGVSTLAGHAADVRARGDQVVDVAVRGERQLDDLPRERRGADRRARLVELDRLGLADHGDRLADARHLHVDVQGDLDRRDQPDALVLDGLEAAELGADVVDARLERRNPVEALSVAHRGAADVGVGVGRRHGGPGHEGARGVAHGPRDRGARHLRGRERREGQQPGHREAEEPRLDSVHGLPPRKKTAWRGDPPRKTDDSKEWSALGVPVVQSSRMLETRGLLSATELRIHTLGAHTI